MTSVTVTCARCGVAFCLPAHLNVQLRENHETFYCPNGHGNHYPQETEAERLKRKVKRLEHVLDIRDAKIDHLEQCLDQAHRTCPFCGHVFRWPSRLREHLAAPIEEGGHGATPPPVEEEEEQAA